MYSPKAFIIDDPETIWELIAKYPFAIVFSVDGTITHIPINRFQNGRLYGHCARANAHANLETGTNVVAVFSGPHAYVSPNHYASEFNVPTWNYATVHCRADIEYIDAKDEVWKLFTEMVAIYEGQEGWQLPAEKRFMDLLNGIRFFELRNPEFEAKLKFNQNKSDEDVLSVISKLRTTNPDAADVMVMANKVLHADALKRAGEL